MAINTPFNSTDLTATPSLFTALDKTKLDSLSSTGNYFDFGSMRMQWGTASVVTDSGDVVTMPLSFANNTYVLSLSADNGWTTTDTAVGPFKWANKTTSSFVIDRDDDVTGTALVDWIAIGVKP